MDEPEYIKNYDELLEKKLLAFLTYVDHEGIIKQEIEIYADILRTSENDVHVNGEIWKRIGEDIEVKYESEFCLPFGDGHYWYAEEGEYELIISKQRVPNPDILTRWRVHSPKN